MQSSLAEVDARLDADLRTAIPGVFAGVKYQPERLETIHQLLVNKRSNLLLDGDI